MILRKKRKQTIMLFFYRTNAIRVALDKEEQAMTKVMAAQAKTMVVSKTAEPMYSHRSRHRERPNQLHSDNCTLLGYWEINGVKAHCLLDSGSEGCNCLQNSCKPWALRHFPWNSLLHCNWHASVVDQ